MTSTSGVVGSGSAHIDGLLSSTKWASTSITYSFPTAKSDVAWFTTYRSGNTFEEFNSAQKLSVERALENYSDVSGLSFSKVDDSLSSHGTLRFWESNHASTAYAYYPTTASWGGDSVFNPYEHNDPQIGTYAGMTAIHEIGHTLGLSHGHTSSGGFGTLDYAKDSLEYSVMTYKSYVGAFDANYETNQTINSAYTNAAGSYSSTIMQSDIAAIQHMYGANYGTNSGDTTYTWSTSTGVMSIKRRKRKFSVR